MRELPDVSDRELEEWCRATHGKSLRDHFGYMNRPLVEFVKQQLLKEGHVAPVLPIGEDRGVRATG